MPKAATWWQQLLQRKDAPAVMPDEGIVGGHPPQGTIVVVQRADRDHGDGLGAMTDTTALADYVLQVEDMPSGPPPDIRVRLFTRRAAADQVQEEEMRRVADLADYVLYAADAAAGEALVYHMVEIALGGGQRYLREVLDNVSTQWARRGASERGAA